MQRIIDDPTLVVEGMLQGFLVAHPDIVAATSNPRVLRAVDVPIPGKVGIVTGGGSGHKPAFIGYLGRNMVDAVAVGEVFTSPSAQAFADAFRTANGGAGIACLYGNYAGDNMNVKLARRMVEKDGIRVETVIANDDVPSAPGNEREKRRGVAGEVLMWKVGGAKAAAGGTLDEVVAAAQKAIDNTRSIGVGLAPCTIPAVGHPNFQIEPGMMEVGIGHHGEPGVRVTELRPAREIARLMFDTVLPDLPFRSGDDTAVLVSGLGATPAMELYILFSHVVAFLREAGISVWRSWVGNYFTSLEMMGVTLSVMRLDDELRECLDLDAVSVGLTHVRR
ncbi:MAG: dihydroxyacetone kinase subunit DhaK [Candidatus Limnocylindrales bacterium]